MILYYSGTGNSRYTAERLSILLGDELFSINDALKKHERGKFGGSDRIVVVSPTYAWRLPRIVSDWIALSSFSPSAPAYFVMTCGDSIHNAQAYNRMLCRKKDLLYKGTVKIIMPENYIALFNSPTLERAEKIVLSADRYIEKAAHVIANGGEFSDKKTTFRDGVISGPVNSLFYRFIVKAKQFHANSDCTGCSLCSRLCPLGNIEIKEGRPVWGKQCTHCMACISYCPSSAIEYGKKSQGKVRYTIEKIKSDGKK